MKAGSDQWSSFLLAILSLTQCILLVFYTRTVRKSIADLLIVTIYFSTGVVMTSADVEADPDKADDTKSKAGDTDNNVDGQADVAGDVDR